MPEDGMLGSAVGFWGLELPACGRCPWLWASQGLALLGLMACVMVGSADSG